jgi:hypothetical protein
MITRVEGRVAEDVLHVERHEEEHRQHRERDHERDSVGAEELAALEEAELDHREPDSPLRDGECERAGGRDRKQTDDPPRAPAPVVALDEREHERANPDRETGDAGVVDDPGDARIA